MTLLLVYLLIALGFSFLCSILEAVVLSITPAYVAAESGRNTAFGHRLSSLKQDIDRPLAAILTLNTFAHTIGAAGVCAQAQRLWGEESLSVVSAVVTVLIYWKRLARPSIAITRLLTLLLLPFVWVSQLLTRLLRRGHTGSVLSRADIRNVVDVGYRDGILRRNEKAIISNLMGFQAITVTDIMTPRPVIVALEESTAIGSLGPGRVAWFVSRIPIYVGDLDHVTGYVLKDEILSAQVRGDRTAPISTLRRPLLRVRQNLPMPELYSALAEASEHIALVEDAAGATVGLVTLEDLIETMLGLEILDEADANLDLKARARAVWERRARGSGIHDRVVQEGDEPPA